MKKDLMFYNISFSLLLGIFVTYFLSFTGFIFHISINLFYPVLGILTVLFSVLFLSKKDNLNTKEILFSYIFLILPIVVFYFLSITLIDTTYDGREYHQASTILLKQGYNPIYEMAQDFFERNYPALHSVSIWVDNYPKCFEIIAANIFLFTERIESGKIINALSSIILFYYAYYIMNKYYKKKYAGFFSFLFVINPISLSQLMMYYSDGFVYNLFMIVLLSVIDIEKTQKFKPYFIYSMSIVILSNIKYSGVFYSVLLILFLLFLLIKQKQKLKYFYFFTVISLILVVLSGINPYFTNIAKGRNPLYPVAGVNKIDIVTHNLPKNFIDKNMPYKFIMSTFSKCDNLYRIDKFDVFANPKIPFTFDKNELKYIDIDTRVCGFGVLWSGILILSLIGLFMTENKNLYVPIFLLISVLIVPQNWWARYVPQFYAFPVFISLFLFQKEIIFKKLFSIIISLFIITNTCLFMYGLTVERFIHLNKDYFIDCNVQAELNYSDFLISYLQHKKEYKIYNMENVVNEK